MIEEDRVSEKEAQKTVDLRGHRLIGSGGEHLVFLKPGGTNVVKLNYPSVAQLASGNAEQVQWEAIRRNEETALLQRYFDKHMPDSKSEVVNTQLAGEQLAAAIANSSDISPEAAAQLFGVESLRTGQLIETEALATTQTAMPLDTTECLSFSIESISDSELEEDLALIQEDFLCQGQTETYITQARNFYPSLVPLVEKALTSEQWKGALRDFVERLIAFTKDTGRAIDIEGANNIMFLEQQNEEQKLVTYVLLDILQLEPKSYVESMAIFKKWLESNGTMQTNINEMIPQELHQLRALNLLAAITGSEARLDAYQMTSEPTSDQPDRQEPIQLSDFIREATSYYQGQLRQVV